MTDTARVAMLEQQLREARERIGRDPSVAIEELTDRMDSLITAHNSLHALIDRVLEMYRDSESAAARAEKAAQRAADASLAAREAIRHLACQEGGNTNGSGGTCGFCGRDQRDTDPVPAGHG